MSLVLSVSTTSLTIEQSEISRSMSVHDCDPTSQVLDSLLLSLILTLILTGF